MASPRQTMSRLSLAVMAVALLVGCGSQAGPKAQPGVSQKTFEQQLAEAANVSAADVLAVTRRGSRLLGAGARVTVRPDTPIPGLGERPPAIDTDTVQGAGGNIGSIDTRIPHAPELHKVSLREVLGRKPTVLLFATPQLCQSRVCGPVVDIELQ